MSRHVNSLFAGTLLLSFLFSPARQSSPEAAVEASTLQVEDQHGGKERTASKSGGYELSKQDRRHIQQEAQALYAHDLDSVIADECRRGDFSSARKNGVSKNLHVPDRCRLGLSNFIIALLPDPARTHLALQFDRSIEAIQESLQDEHYLFVHSTMPWDPKSHPVSDDHAEREATNIAETAKQGLPGVMIFRAQQGGLRSPLFVFVVGEAPTGGINKDQFQNAVQQIQQRVRSSDENKSFSLRDASTWAHAPGDPGLRILGPTFSGSLESLDQILQCHKNDDPKQGLKACYPSVSIHSGTASSRSAINAFLDHEKSLNTHFVSFQETDEVMIDRFTEFLAGDHYGRRTYDRKKIVLLSEDETAYGTGSGCTSDHQARHLGYYGQRPETAGQAYSTMAHWFWPTSIAANETNANRGCQLTIYFPREISQLRTAYQKDVDSPPKSVQNAPRDILPTYSDIPGSDDDTVASYSGLQMPLSQEGVMLGIVSELKKQNAEFIILRASDPMDSLFLARYLRAAYPQGRVVTLGADMLFRREAEDPRFHGLLSLSTYSLSTSANQGFSDYEEQHKERVFPSTFEAGVYNGMRSLLVAWADEKWCASTAQQDCRLRLSSHFERRPLLLYQYGSRQQPQDGDVPGSPGSFTNYDAPPVRLLALGRDQYWPIAALGPFEGEQPASLLPEVSGQIVRPTAPISIPNSWRAVQLVGLGLAIFFCWSLWSSSIFSTIQPFARFAPAVRDRRLTLILVAGGTLIFILLILMWPAIHGARSSNWGLERWLLIAVLGVFGTTLLEGISRTYAKPRIWPRPRTEKREKRSDNASLADFGKKPIRELEIAHAVGVAAEGFDGGGAIAASSMRSANWPRLSGIVGKNKISMRADSPHVHVAFKRTNSSPEQKTSSGFVGSPVLSSSTSRACAQLAIFVLGCVVLFLGVGRGEGISENSALIRWYSTLRTVQLTSGLSFIMPTFFFLTVWLWWVEHLSSGYALLDARRPRLPKGMKQPRVAPLLPKSLPELYASIKPSPYSYLRYFAVAALAVTSVFVLMGMDHTITSLEKPILERAMTFLFLIAVAGIVACTFNIWEIWVGVRRLLVQLDMQPLRDGFKGIEGFSWKPIWRFGAGSLPEFLRIFARERDALERAVRTVPGIGDPALQTQMEAVLQRVKWTKRISSKRIKPSWSIRKQFHWKWLLRREAERAVMQEFREYQKKSAAVAGKALDFLAEQWHKEKEEEKHSSLRTLIVALAMPKSVEPSAQQADQPDAVATRACQRFVCMAYVSFLVMILVRLRTLIVAVAGMYVLTLVGISQYPFEPRGALQLMLVGLLALVVYVVGLVFAQIHRDSVLSNITGTTPGELGIDFYIKMGSFVALPLTSLLASQFPSLNRFLYSWLQPAIEALNR